VKQPLPRLALGIGLTLALQLLFWSHVSDDAFISFRYAERLLAGRGLTFNDGERVEGFSHPLWLFLVAGSAWLSGLSVPDAARALGLGFSLATLGCLLRSPAAFVLLLAYPGFHAYATSGLETPLLMFLLTLGVVASLGREETSALASLSFGLSAVTRPEGLLYGLLWLGRRSRALVPLALLFGPFLAYQVFRVAYFDAWAPNSFRAKLPGTWGTFFGLEYLGQAALALGWPFVIFRSPSDTETYRRTRRAATGPILAAILFVVYAWGDWMPFSRFLAPVWPAAALLVADRLPGRRRGMVTALLVVTTLGAYSQSLLRYARNEGLSSMLMRGRDPLAAGRWLDENVAPGSTVVTARLGGMSYGAPELTFWDEGGLTDREQAVWISRGRAGGWRSSPVGTRDPDVVAALRVRARWSYTEDPERLAWLRSRYRLVTSVPQGRFGEVDVWVIASAFERTLRGKR
jgi:hypothetical protein